MPIRKYTSRSQQTTLTSAVTSGATVLPVVAATTLLGGATVSVGQTFTIVIDPDTALEEIVDVYSASGNPVSGNNLTVVRAIDGSSAQDHSAGAVVRHMIIGRDLRESNTHIESSIGVHGLNSTSSVVGTLDTQTLSAKTLTTPTINGATITGSVTSTATITGGIITGAAVTGLSAPSAGSDATTKTYVDSILGSATAASTSATSAATSASSAATSASSAATSASSALTSQTAAATSATSAATQATAAATSATSAATQATAAATSATSAATQATAAATSATSAAASATTAAASVATIATYASNALTSANSASTSAASSLTSANSAATSASSAAASTSAAAASATAAATSATSAAASATAAATSASSALASQTAAATSATSAANSATAAATSATSAAASATAAATSATSSATSASSSLATYNLYKTEYLGSKSSAPTVDNQGNALITGATYWNSTTSLMYAWSGSAWQAISTTSSYSAPTLGSQTIASGTTYTNIDGLTINSTTIPTSKTLVDTNSSQTLTNKTLTGAVASADPTADLGLATKQYVDAVTAAINFHAPVKLATTSNLATTYSNGTSGVGATLTATGNGRGSIDGVNISTNDRILVKDQTTQLQNGIYTVTNQGGAGNAYILTRATDNDNTAEIKNGDVIFVTAGTANTGVTFVNTSTDPVTVGTTAITFSTYTSASLPSQTGQSGKYLTTDGTVPSWGAAAGLATTNTFTAGNTIAPSSTGVVPLTISTPNGSTSNIATFSQAGTGYTASINQFGQFMALLGVFGGTTTNFGGRNNFAPANSTNIAIAVRGQASQTADLQQFQNSAGTKLSAVNATGGFVQYDADGYQVDITLMSIMGAY
jgi:hypothetical protein